MGVFVINEWLWADIQGENENQGRRQYEAAVFLEAFTNSEHQMIIIEHSKFDIKAWAAFKSPAFATKMLAVNFLKLRYDLDRCRLLQIDQLAELPDDLRASVKDDDHYLVCALLTAPESILVTTDRDLCKALRDLPERCISREEFLRDYFGISS